MPEREINEYLNTVCSHIMNKKAHNLIKKELGDHIEDKTDYYINCGMEKGEALTSALKAMGDPTETGKLLNKEYHGRIIRLCVTVAVIATLILGILLYPVFMKVVYSYQLKRDYPYSYSINNVESFNVFVLGDVELSSFYEIQERSIHKIQTLTNDIFDVDNGNVVNAVIISHDRLSEQIESNIDLLKNALDKGYFIYIIGGDKVQTNRLYTALTGDMSYIMNTDMFNITDMVSLQGEQHESSSVTAYSFIYKDQNNIYNYYAGSSPKLLQSIWDNRFKIPQNDSDEALLSQKQVTSSEKLNINEIDSLKYVDSMWNEKHFFDKKLYMTVRPSVFIYETDKYFYYALKHKIILTTNSTNDTDLTNVIRNFNFTISAADGFEICDYSSQYDIPVNATIKASNLTISVLDAYSKPEYNKSENTMNYFINHKYGTIFAKYTSTYSTFTVYRSEKTEASNVFSYTYTLNVNSTEVKSEQSEGYNIAVDGGKVVAK